MYGDINRQANVEGGRFHQVIPLNKQLQATNDQWEEEN